MKRLILAGAMLLMTGPAHAAGVDFVANACAGDAAATSNVETFDCAGGGTLKLLATFQPAANITDLVGVDVFFDIQVDGDVATDANFWDFAGANPAALSVSHVRPVAGCTGSTNTWSPAGSGAYMAARIVSPALVQIASGAYRPSILAVARDENLFAVEVTIDASSSVAVGSPLHGCCLLTRMVATSAQPNTMLAYYTPPLLPGPLTDGVVTINSAAPCAAVPARRHTWGQLNSLFR